MYPMFNVQRASVSGLTANLGGTNSAFHVPGSTSGSNSPTTPTALINAGISPTPFLTNGVQPTLLTTLQAAAAAQNPVVHTSTGSTGPPQTKTVGTVLPLVSTSKLQLSPADRPIKPSSNGSMNDGTSSGFCSICSDRATGKHYGANSCDGCKGFFRRTIRKNQTYSCRFNRTCVIDKDKRNTCRYCRFKKCLQAGMRREAVQNERDRISCKRVKSETPPDHHSASTTSANNIGISKFTTADTISFLLHAESVASQIRASVITSTSVGDSSQNLSNDQQVVQPRLATVHDLSEAIKQQLLVLVEWAKLLPPFYDLPLDDQVALLRGYSAQHLLLGVARRSLPYKDVLLLGNDACIPRTHSSEIHDVKTFYESPIKAQSRIAYQLKCASCLSHVVLRLLDELVTPMREIQLDDTEYACVKALLFFTPSAYGLSMKSKVKETRQNLLEALQVYANQKQAPDEAVRFGNILLLLPPLQAMSQQFIEDLQLATLFGISKFDKLLEELLLAAAEPLSAPFLVDGISAVANKMAGGLMGLVSGNGQSSEHSHHGYHQNHHDVENTHLGNTTVKMDDDQSTMIVDVVNCNEPSVTNTTF